MSHEPPPAEHDRRRAWGPVVWDGTPNDAHVCVEVRGPGLDKLFRVFAIGVDGYCCDASGEEADMRARARELVQGGIHV